MIDATNMSQFMDPFNLSALLKGDGPLNQAAAHQIEAAKERQDAVLEACQKVFGHWCASQKQSRGALAELVRASSSAKGPQDIMAAWGTWSQSALERMSADAKSQMSIGSTLARSFVPAALVPAALVAEPLGGNGHDRPSK